MLEIIPSMFVFHGVVGISFRLVLHVTKEGACHVWTLVFWDRTTLEKAFASLEVWCWAVNALFVQLVGG